MFAGILFKKIPWKSRESIRKIPEPAPKPQKLEKVGSFYKAKAGKSE
jgi:hypothetical protein